MQNRRTLLAAAVLMLALALFFGTLPLYAAGMQSNSNTAGGNDSVSGAVGGALRNAADAVKGAAEDIFGTPGAGRRDAADNTGDGNNAGNNTQGSIPGDHSGSNPGDVPADNGSLNPDAGNGMAGDGTAGDNNTAEDMLPGDGMTSGTDPAGNGAGGADNPSGDELLPGETAGDGATLGDVNGDGMTDDRAPETTGTEAESDTGFSWGGILLAILTAAAVVVVVVMLLPRKSKR